MIPFEIDVLVVACFLCCCVSVVGSVANLLVTYS